MELRAVLVLASLVSVVLGAGGCAHTDVTAGQAQRLITATDDLIIVDVRERSEYCDARGHIPGALNYPYTSGVLEARYQELPKDHPILVVCRSGRRSNLAAELLRSHGFTEVYDMTGGMKAWEWETAPCDEASR